jgi:hypothetical protein
MSRKRLKAGGLKNTGGIACGDYTHGEPGLSPEQTDRARGNRREHATRKYFIRSCFGYRPFRCGQIPVARTIGDLLLFAITDDRGFRRGGDEGALRVIRYPAILEQQKQAEKRYGEKLFQEMTIEKNGRSGEYDDYPS